MVFKGGTCSYDALITICITIVSQYIEEYVYHRRI